MVTGKKFIKALVAGIMLVTVLSACDSTPPSPECVMADDFGDMTRKNIQVNASGKVMLPSGVVSGNGQWLDTGVEVQANKILKISSSGSVGLCNSSASTRLNLSVTNGGWQDSGLSVTADQNYSISVSGRYSRFSNHSGCGGANSSHWNAQCYTEKGKGLFMYIGENPNGISNWSSRKPLQYSVINDEGGINPEFFSNNPEFVEMYNTTSPGYSVIVPNGMSIGNNTMPSGKLWFRYEDSADGYKNNWNGNYSDNTDGYAVDVVIHNDCVGHDGQFLIGYLGNTPPADGASLISSPGLINLNAYAVADNSANPPRKAGEYSGVPTAVNAKLWLKIVDIATSNYWGNNKVSGDGDYTEYQGPQMDGGGNVTSPASGSNSGSYSVEIVTPKPPSEGFTNVITQIIDPVRTILIGNDEAPGVAQVIYNGVTNNGDFIAAVRAAMVLAIVFMAFQYMVGLSNITQKEVFNLSIKMAIVVTLTSPGSWEFFYKYLFIFFVEGVDNLIWIMSSQLSTVIDAPTASGAVTDGSLQQDAFSFLNQTVAMTLANQTWIKVGSLMGMFPLGIVMGILIAVGFLFFWYAIIKAIIIYIISIVMTALLLAISPLCISFILFSRTRSIFDKWARHLMSYMLQPILLFTVLAVFNIFIYSALYTMLGFSVCWGCLMKVNLGITDAIGVGDFDKFCLIPGYAPWGVGGEQTMATKLVKTPVVWFSILIFIMLCNAMLKFLDWILDFAGAATEGGAAINLGKDAGRMMAQGADAVKSTAQFGVQGGRAAAQLGMTAGKTVGGILGAANQGVKAGAGMSATGMAGAAGGAAGRFLGRRASGAAKIASGIGGAVGEKTGISQAIKNRQAGNAAAANKKMAAMANAGKTPGAANPKMQMAKKGLGMAAKVAKNLVLPVDIASAAKRSVGNAMDRKLDKMINSPSKSDSKTRSDSGSSVSTDGE